MLAARWCSGQQDTWTGLSVKGRPSPSGLDRVINALKMFPASYFLIFPFILKIRKRGMLLF